MPLAWIFSTGFKTPPDSIAYPPKVIFEPTLEGYVNLFTTRTRVRRRVLAACRRRDLRRPDRARRATW
jgi:multiple sugar transport system permease protein